MKSRTTVRGGPGGQVHNTEADLNDDSEVDNDYGEESEEEEEEADESGNA